MVLFGAFHERWSGSLGKVVEPNRLPSRKDRRADRPVVRLAEHLTRMDFIVLDELGYLPFAQSGGQLLFHLVIFSTRRQRHLRQRAVKGLEQKRLIEVTYWVFWRKLLDDLAEFCCGLRNQAR
ncbi:IstB-like ATP binding protein [Bradyrhizobium yuanmingense]|uniref:IstB-like ATP binding protein n=1 Tax=Bradyrhizobium yuanmingense TaxID=108015 RepID=A0A1C3VI53_9BRAD|nr:IstB-like ATP binding protein [Bradyrhizobium yuanmingense]SCB27277.1 IstB-like ATP binding protein [Bradyrhizobium yuanmingense]